MITSDYGKFRVNIDLDNQNVILSSSEFTDIKLSVDDFIDFVFVLTDSVFKTSDYAADRLIDLLHESFSASKVSKEVENTSQLMNTVYCGTC